MQTIYKHKIGLIMLFLNFFPHPEKFNDIRMNSPSFLMLDLTKFPVKMSSADPSELSFPLNRSGSEIRVVKRKGIFSKMFKATVKWMRWNLAVSKLPEARCLVVVYIANSF